jgi:hypothetical protein
MQFVTGERASAVTVPRNAIVRLGGGARVWVADAERVTPRDVTVGLESTDRAEVVSGLTGNERVVVRGHEGLYAGARIVVTRPLGREPEIVAPRGGDATREKGGGHAGH